MEDRDKTKEELLEELGRLRGRILELEERDIARKRTEDELRSSEEWFRILFEQSKDAIFVADALSRQLVDCNLQAERLIGKPRQEILKMRADELHPADMVEATMAVFQRQASGEDISAETFVITGNGRRIPVSINTANITVNGNPRLIGTFRDMSEQRKAGEALRQSEERYRSMVDNISIGVALISQDMKILSLNRQMKAWFPKIRVDDMPVCYRAFNNPPRDSICSYCPTARTLKDGLVHEGVTETPVEGRIFNYRIISSPIKDAAGNVIAAIEMVDDITERTRLENEARQYTHDLEVFYKASIGREERILELKKEIEALKREACK